jgi:GT2 family glycosyltransferase
VPTAPFATVAVVLTCFNRRELTLASLTALYKAAAQAGVHVLPVVVDDASTDGTSAAVRRHFPQARVIETSGDLYWCRGMHQGIRVALTLPVQYLLWLNDDTILKSDALQRLLQEQSDLAVRLGKAAILVGATADLQGKLTYGGDVCSGKTLRRFNYRRVGGESQPVRCDAMNGNCVLVPIGVAQLLGNVDPVFEHAMGDTDYALRAKSAGVPVYVASGFVGECGANTAAGGFMDLSLPLRARWRAVMERKGLPWRSWLHFTRRHGGTLWPVYFVWPYARVVLSSLRPSR